MQILRDQLVPMRDGVRIACDIYRPDRHQRGPALLSRTPYLKDAYRMGGGPLPGQTAVFPRPEEAVRPFIEAGFAVVITDTRGTGHSEGEYDYYNFDAGPWDGYDLVEWLAAESWCDGAVGMFGTSAGGVLTYAAANERPPSLKAIAPHMHPADPYLDQWFVGGVFRYQARIGWAVNMLQRTSPLDHSAVEGVNRSAIRNLHQVRFDRYHQRMLRGENPVEMEWLTAFYRERRRTDFWRRISAAERHDRVSVPSYIGGVWYDHFLRGTLSAHAAANGPKRLHISPWMHGAPAGDGDFAGQRVRWFEHYLRGTDNGIDDTPGARVYLLGAERWLDEPTWPVALPEHAWFLDADGSLQDAPGTNGAVALSHDPDRPNRSPSQPHDQRRFETGAAVFTSAPFERATRVIGSPRLVLHTTSDATDADWLIRVCDVYPDGRSRLLNYGALKASHRDSHETPTPTTPGEVTVLDIEIWATANVFLPGHCLRVVVSNSDFPAFETNPIPSRNQILVGHDQPSRLLVAAVPD